MSTDPKLEAYLSSLDKALGPISVSDRSEILIEIKSHIMDSQERNPNQPLTQVLASLGEPETVANRYLLERGLKPGKPPKSPIIKWLTVGFLGTLGILCLTGIIMVWKFSPIVSIDEENERVSILGGSINIDGKAGKVQVGDQVYSEEMDGKVFNGTRRATEKLQSVRIEFTNAKLNLSPSVSGELKWNCRVQEDPKMSDDKGAVTFELAPSGSKCDLEIPKGATVAVRGTNGKLELVETQAATEITLTNGKISIRPDSKVAYKYDLNVTNGSAEGFESSELPNAVSIKVSLTNGSIKKD